MNPTTDPSALALRDIHLPDSVSWWPLAPGWWIAAFLFVLMIATILFLIRRSREKRLSAITLAKGEVERIKNNFDENKDKKILAKELSELIRRFSISIVERAEVASLTGQNWLLFLDKMNGDNAFSEGVGRVLVEAPYQAEPDYDSSKLIGLIENWMVAANKSVANKTRVKQAT